MQKTAQLSVAEKLMSLGLFFITVLVWTGSTLDPVNLPKMLLLGTVAFALIPSVVHLLRQGLWRFRNPYVVLVLLCILWTVLASFLAGSNFIQSIYGVTGRFTGALTYLAFYVLALFSFLHFSSVLYHRILGSLILAGIVNIVYCGVVILTGKDPIPWSNVYGNILGTFGNPNFVSSFLGMFMIVIFSKLVENRISRKLKVAGYSVLLVALLQIIDSNSRQGIIVAAIGCGAVLIYRIKVSSNNKSIKLLALGIFSSAGVLATLGMLQIGPLTSLIYKASVSIRGAYWRAGWETMLQNPFFGTGPDGFGDWYARVRDARAMVVPGPDVFTNSPHNVFIEQGANGGIPLFMAYLFLQVYVLYCGVRYLQKSKQFDYLFSASFFGWLGFTAQSLISINQIGLAIWGFVLGAMTVGLYQSSTKAKGDIVTQVKATPKVTIFGEYQRVLISVGAMVGIALYIPPFLSDANWRSALESKKLANITSAAERWPQSTDRYIQVTKALYENKFVGESLTFARKGVSFNPNSARLWYFLYQLPGSTASEKDLALEKLKVLDPNFVAK